ncbi:hypothetical protein GJ698_07845 [Pseudoduganella sp. FT26W]|uniref:Uncharacterized protein n=1 Tax=Duganella aquatilis TaxID=2666082 RepID=A0A844CVS6_9BURK|nr:hypothetical protein [Duganella aquatilis]MRW84008.1 hypothetical protein [Duganella aquatilis]
MRRLFAAVAISLPLLVHAQECDYSLWSPSRETINVDDDYALSITRYDNDYRRSTVRDAARNIDMYAGQGLVLVKGYSLAELSEPLLPWSRLGLVPLKIVSAFSLSGISLCHAPGSLQAHIELEPGAWNTDKHSGEGEIVYGSPGELHYAFNVNKDDLWPGRTNIRYSGEISFATRSAPPSDDTDFSGYTLLTVNPETAEGRIWGVAGTAGMPSTLGALRRHVKSR